MPSSAPPSDQPTLTGQVLGDRYRLLRPLGHGGMATIWEAEHVDIEKRVAVKVLAPEHARCQTMAQRFLNEAKAASRLRHDHIIDITDYGRGPLASGESVAYFAMEYLEGEDLAVTLEHDGPLRWTRVLTIAKQICEALIAAHDRGIVHCDIKPANCFRIVRSDTADFIKVLDFGVASFASEETGKCMPAGPVVEPDGETSGRRSAPRLGTPGYMAGELLSGEPYDHRVDIYALGVLMYRLLTNKMPYAAARLYDSGPSGLTPAAQAGGEGSGMTRPPSGPEAAAPYPMRRAIPTLEIPAEFEALVLKAVARDPDRRFQTARALYEALVAVEQASTRPSPLPQDPLRWDEVTAPAADDSASMSQTEATREAASSSMLDRTDPDIASGYANPAWLARPRPGWPRLAMLVVLAAVATTAAVRVAWALSG
jgi:serine/threonine protein kinase